ncbi:hypothetical protein BH09ACT3_BH09ACT3_05080 [soil metagenome]
MSEPGMSEPGMSEPQSTEAVNRKRAGRVGRIGLAALVAVVLVVGSSAATLAITLSTLAAARPASAVAGMRVADQLPQELREDLLAIREAPEAERAELFAELRETAGDGGYGRAAQRFVERADDLLAEQPEELQAAIEEIRTESDPGLRRDLIQKLRSDVDAGVYGDEPRKRADQLREAFGENGVRGLIREFRAGR